MSLSMIAGSAASALGFALCYVRGDLLGVLRFLSARRELEQLKSAEAPTALIQAAQANVLQRAETLAQPALAEQLWPLAALFGLGVAWAVWRWFGELSGRPLGYSQQERAILRLAYRRGGRFTLAEVQEYSPLGNASQALSDLLDRGLLEQVGDEYRLRA